MNSNLPMEIERKYIILKPSEELIHQFEQCQRSYIFQAYLKPEKNAPCRRVRKRGTDNEGFKYYYTEKTDVSFGERIEIEREISEQEFLTLLNEKDESREPIEKERICFKYFSQLFELDIYPFSEKYATLEIELDDINQSVTLPDFLEFVKDITGDNSYNNYQLAKKRKIEI